MVAARSARPPLGHMPSPGFQLYYIFDAVSTRLIDSNVVCLVYRALHSVSLHKYPLSPLGIYLRGGPLVYLCPMAVMIVPPFSALSKGEPYDSDSTFLLRAYLFHLDPCCEVIHSPTVQGRFGAAITLCITLSGFRSSRPSFLLQRVPSKKSLMILSSSKPHEPIRGNAPLEFKCLPSL
ncbi:hypothetical protein BC834DRAFT_455967 [Gloeopeniophorella convolvens]|nr:hypothetical protein BC834DRAFT_455967 [Gloeopeniophorella convolvens]